jgi:hypothetical protein
MLKAYKCTIDAAKYALIAWKNHVTDQDYCFIAERVAEYDAEHDKIIWLPIRDIEHGRSELIDMAVDTPTHSYIANGIVVHNSQVARTVILAYIKKEARDRKNSNSYVVHLDNKPKPTSDIIIRFLAEARDMCQYHDDYLRILKALEWLICNDDRPYDGIIGKLVDASELSRPTVTSFMRFVKLRSLEFTDSPMNKVDPDGQKSDHRKPANIDFDEE